MNQPSLDSTTSPLVDHLHRLHWSSLLFDSISQIRNIVLPALFGLVGAARGDAFWMWLSMFFLIPTLLVSVFRYFTLSYQINDGQLIVKHGLIFRNVRTVPVDRIQNIDFVQNLLHRLFGVAEVRVETAGGSEPEATLRVLGLDKVEQLRSAVFESRNAISSVLAPQAATAPDVIATAELDAISATQSTTAAQSTSVAQASLQSDAVVDSDSMILEIPIGNLIWAGLASDRGLLLVLAAIGLVYESEIFEKIDFDQLGKFMPQNPGNLILALAVVLGLLVAYLLLKILSAIWYIIRFYGYRLVKRRQDLRISCGLTTKVHATIPQRRIQFISVHRGWMMRLLGLCSVRIETASAGSGHEDASKSVSSRWFIPVLAEQKLPAILELIRPNIAWNETEFCFHAISPQAFQRRIRFYSVCCIGLSGMLFFWLSFWALLIAAGIWTLLAVATSLVHRSMGYARTQEGVVFRSGVITKKISITFFEKIQSVRVRQNPLDRHWKMARLTVDTAAAGPAEHRIDVPLLDQTFASSEMSAITTLAAQHQPNFR